MTLRAYLYAVLAGALSAAFYLAVGLGSMGALILAYMAQLPLFAIGLNAGFQAVMVASAVGLMVIVLALPVSAAGLFALTTALPVLFLVNRALLSREADDGSTAWYPAGYLLATLNAIALVLLAAGAVILSGRDGGIVGAGQALLAEMISGFAESMGTAPAPTDVIANSTLAKLLPAIVLTSWQIMVVINGLLAYGALARFGATIRPGEPLTALTLPRWLTVVLAVALLAALPPGQIGALGRNAAVVVALPFFFLGLSVIHAVSIRWPGRAFILLGIYLILFVAGWPALIVAVIGVFEPWTNLRARLVSPPRDDEEE